MNKKGLDNRAERGTLPKWKLDSVFLWPKKTAPEAGVGNDPELNRVRFPTSGASYLSGDRQRRPVIPLRSGQSGFFGWRCHRKEVSNYGRVPTRKSVVD